MASMTLDGLVTQLQAAYGDALNAVVLYGSAAAGEHIPKRSDYNVLVIANDLTAERLRAAAAVAAAWSAGGNPPPLTLTLEEWRSSSDIFPMEYADILERHRVLHGTPPLEGIKVDREHLRLQVERETMGKLLKFRQGVLAAGNDGKNQLVLLEDSLSTMMVIFRGVSRLFHESPSTDYHTLAASVAARAGFDAEPFSRVVRHVRGETKLSPRELDPVIAGYLAGLERLVGFIDQVRAV